jgi:4-hydroxy-tetrahydrodipicolinate synthase
MLSVKGIIVPLITPLLESEQLDEAGLCRLIDHVIAGGVHGVFALGSTGEFYALDPEQKQRIMEVTVAHTAGRVPVYIGASAITTRECVRMVRMASRAGAQAVSVLTPMFVNPTDQELYDHFRTIAEAENIPILLYNNPDRTGVNLSAVLVERLARLDNVIGIKDSSGDMTLTAEYIRRTRGSGFQVVAGRDTLVLAVLAYGGTGAVAATANVMPRLLADIYDRFSQGDLAGALEAQYRIAPLRMAFSLGTFPSVTKDALNLMGIDVGPPVRPVQHLSEENLVKLKKILATLQNADN